MTEDEMVGWHQRLNGLNEFEATLGDGQGQGNLVYYSPCGHKESDTTERLNNNSNSTQCTLLEISQFNLITLL